MGGILGVWGLQFLEALEVLNFGSFLFYGLEVIWPKLDAVTESPTFMAINRPL